MRAGAKGVSVDFCTRPLLGKIIKFSLPLIFTAVLQLLYNAADIVVVGRFAGKEAMGAVSSTGALVNLVTNLFIGLSVGSLAVMARYVGAKNEEKADAITHTSIALSLAGGVVIGIAGFFLSGLMLTAMDTPQDILPLSTLYLKIFFIGMPFNLLYNFGSAVLRACGDTKRPMIYLSIAGIVNILLNLLTVIVFKMSVAGVALATVISQVLSSVLVVVCLMKRKGYGKFVFKKLRFNRGALIDIVKIGLPAGIQSTIFSMSNVIIQSSINGLGTNAVAGNGAAANIEGFVYASMNSVAQACLTFTGQNFGAAKKENLTPILVQCIGLVTAVGVIMGIPAYLFGGGLLSIYNPDPEVIAWGLERLSIVCTMYFICGIMEVLVSAQRGIGYSLTPMVISILGVCGVRIVWIFTVFKWTNNQLLLYASYPVSWLFTALVHLVCLCVIKARQKSSPSSTTFELSGITGIEPLSEALYLEENNALQQQCELNNVSLGQVSDSGAEAQVDGAERAKGSGDSALDNAVINIDALIDLEGED